MDPIVMGTAHEATEPDYIVTAPPNDLQLQKTVSDNPFSVADFDDLLLCDFNPFDFNIFNLPPPPPPPPLTAGHAKDSISSEEPTGSAPSEPGTEHTRSLSLDSNYLEAIRADSTAEDDDGGGGKDKTVEKHHRHSSSADGSSTAALGKEKYYFVKKAMAPEKLAELARVDPKRAKRIIANRKSAAKSKERKAIYTTEMEKKVQGLKTEATSLSTQLVTLKSETAALASHNKEIKICIASLRQQAQLKIAISEAIKEEAKSLRNESQQFATMMANPSFGGLASQFSSQLSLNKFNNPPSQHLVPQQPQLCMPPPLPPSGQSFNQHYDPNFMNFNQPNYNAGV